MECRDIQISCIVAKSLAEPLEACRPKEGLKPIAPKHPKILGRAVKRAPHKEVFIPDVTSWVSRASWQDLQEHTDLRRSRVRGAQVGWQGRRHARGIVRPRYKGAPTSRRSFWCPDDQHSCLPFSGAVVLRYRRPQQ
jgi:hypothetical protein